jgi:hypothetical protein
MTPVSKSPRAIPPWVLYLLVLAGTFVAVAAGGLFVVSRIASDVPAYQMKLVGTDWVVVSVDDIETGLPRPPLRLQQGEAAVLLLDCGEVWLAWSMDTDGAALSFGENRVPASCNAASDGPLVKALLSTEEWSIQDDDHITLIGESVVLLERAS